MFSSDDAQANTPAAHELVERLDSLSTAPESSQGRSGAELNVGILLWPRFPLLSPGGLCDALRHAADRSDQSRQLRCLWTTIGVQDTVVESSCGIAVPVQSAFPEAGQFDYVVAIGGLLALQMRLDIPMLLITHDPEDVAAFGDEVVRLVDGRVEQQAAPASLTHEARTTPWLVARPTGCASDPG